MARRVIGKVMWVGRATVFAVGLAVVLAAVFGLAGAALAASGKPFVLGKLNVSSAVTTLIKKGPGPALSLKVAPRQPPLQVNSAGKVANLNADSMDGLDSGAFLRASGKARDADMLDGNDSGAFLGANAKAADSARLDGLTPGQLRGPGRSDVTTTDASANTPTICDPVENPDTPGPDYLTCAFVELTLPVEGRVLLVADGQWRQQTGIAAGRCRFVGPGVSNAQVELGGGPPSGSLGLTEVTGPIPAGAHTFAVQCREFGPPFGGADTYRFEDMQMSAVYVGSG